MGSQTGVAREVNADRVTLANGFGTRFKLMVEGKEYIILPGKVKMGDTHCSVEVETKEKEPLLVFWERGSEEPYNFQL